MFYDNQNFQFILTLKPYLWLDQEYFLFRIIPQASVSSSCARNEISLYTISKPRAGTLLIQLNYIPITLGFIRIEKGRSKQIFIYSNDHSNSVPQCLSLICLNKDPRCLNILSHWSHLYLIPSCLLLTCWVRPVCDVNWSSQWSQASRTPSCLELVLSLRVFLLFPW